MARTRKESEAMNQPFLPGIPPYDCAPPIFWLTTQQLRRGGWIVLEDPETTAEAIGRALAEREAPTRRKKRP